MDFDGAISAHIDWKMKLRAYISKPDKSLNPATVGKDDQCALGKWIHSEGAKFAAIPEFAELKTVHAKFHKCAGEVITVADTGATEKANGMIASGSEYLTVSTKCVSLIRDVRQKAGA
ncbi:CZB domain-containing protein [Bdellovibrionota bacterium FG-1]